MSKKKKGLKVYQYVLSLLWRQEKSVYIFLVGMIVSRVWIMFVLMLFPKFVIDAITGAQGREWGFYYAAIMALSLAAGRFLQNRMDLGSKRRIAAFKEKLVLLIQKKVLGTEYESLESPEYMDQYQKASMVYTSWQADFDRCMEGVVQFLTSVLSLAGLIGILLALNPWIEYSVASEPLNPLQRAIHSE